MDDVDDVLLEEAGSKYGAVCERARARRRQLGRRRPSQAELDQEWLIRYVELLRSRLLWMIGKGPMPPASQR